MRQEPLATQVAPGADLVTLRVSDHGRGMSPSEQATVFEKFRRPAARPPMHPARTPGSVSPSSSDLRWRLTLTIEPESGTEFTVAAAPATPDR